MMICLIRYYLNCRKGRKFMQRWDDSGAAMGVDR